MVLDSHCNWKLHCETLIVKLKQLNFLINKIKDFVPTGCLRDLYFGHFHSHLTYGLRLWGNNSSKTIIDTIYKQQKRSIRIMTKSNYYAHTDPLFKRVKVLKLSEQLKLDNIKLAYRVVYDKCSVSLKNLFDSNHSNSRNHGLLIRKHKSKLYNESFLCQSIMEWNALSIKLKESSFYSIKTNFKK